MSMEWDPLISANMSSCVYVSSLEHKVLVQISLIKQLVPKIPTNEHLTTLMCFVGHYPSGLPQYVRCKSQDMVYDHLT